MKEEDIVKLYNTLTKEDDNVKGLWDIIERFVVPFKGGFFMQKSSEAAVEWRKRQIYDSTAVQAAQTLAASMQGNLIPPGVKWFNMRFRDETINDDHEAAKWIEEVVETIMNMLADSNFDLEIAEAFINLVSFGSALVTEEYDKEERQLVFKTLPQREATFRENHNGNVDALARSFEWSARQIIEKFEKLPDSLKDVDVKKETKYTIIFCIYEREDLEKNGKEDDVDTTLPIAPKARPYGYKYVLKDSSELLEEGGYYEMPAFIPRWRKVAGSKWGHSPAIVVLSNILTLNEITEQILEATAKGIEPPIFTTKRGILSDINLSRRGLTVVKDINAFKEFVTEARIDVGERRIAALQESIQQAFFIDQLQLKESPAMTATEVNVRYELMQRLLGPTVGRMKNDLFDQLIKRTFSIALRENRLPEAPDIVSEADYDIEYLGPLPRSQKMQESQGIIQWLGSLEQLALSRPEVRDIPDYDSISRLLGKNMGVPESAINGTKEVDSKRKKDTNSKQAQAQDAIMSGQALEAVGKGQKALAEAQNVQ